MRPGRPKDDYYLDIARAVASGSKDPSTQVGAVLVSPQNHIISTGYNGMPDGYPEDEAIWQRPVKYEYVIHGEENAIVRAARHGVSTLGAHLYCTHFPCHKCARLIVGAGIKYVVSETSNLGGDWDESHKRSADIFDRTGVIWRTQPPPAVE